MTHSLFTTTKRTALSVVVVAVCALTGYFVPAKTADACFLVCGLGLGATEVTQIQNNVELGINSAQNTITAGNTTALMAKEGADALAWSVAKQMVSNLTQSMVEWINSGFEGSPAFVTDFDGMLKDSLDSAAGQYIESLGGIGELICSPFKLDVTAALQISYQQSQSDMPSGPTACTLSGIENNIQNFLSGAPTSISDWAQITSNPQNTPYGAYLAADQKLNIKLQNEAGKTITIANWGQGFLSKKICEGADGQPAATGKNCKITTPGGVIAQQINYQLHTGTESLIQADEVDEVIGALINQLTLQAMQGANGLLGLGGNTSYTDSYGTGGSSYISAATGQETALNYRSLAQQVASSTEIETKYLTLANSTLATANGDFSVITTGQSAITNIINSSTAISLGINASSTYADAQSRLNAAVASHTLADALLADLQTQLTAVYNSFAVITALDKSGVAGADLMTVPLGSIKAETVTIQTSLITLINQVNPLIPQIQNTLIALAQITTGVSAAGTPAVGNSSANDAALQKAATDYLTLVQSGAIISTSGLTAKQAAWQKTLGR